MKILKKALVALAVVLVLVVVVSFFLPSRVHVERSKVVSGPPAAAFEQVNTLKNWNNWSPWHRIDPKNTTWVLSEKPGGEGAWYSWKSPNSNVGNGKLTITKSVPNENVEGKLEFEGMSIPSVVGYAFKPEGSGTRVTYSMDSNVGQPFVLGKYIGLFMDEMIGPTFEKGLASLDSTVAHPAPAGVTVK